MMENAGDARLPNFDDVRRAASRLEGVAVRTPLLRSDVLDAMTGGRVLLKAECLQRTGSFKIRGAYNRLRQLVETGQDRGGVVAFSSGNHAQGVAAAASLLGMKAAIVMPSDAPALKIENTRRLGGEVILYDRWREDRETIATELAARRNAVLVPSFDDAGIIAGQGTVGLEMAEDVQALGLTLDAVYTPASGGGLAAGVGLALSGISPSTALYTAEPAGFDDHAKSLVQHRIVANDAAARSICDALLSPKPGNLTFALNRDSLAGGVVATDDEALRAMAFAFHTLKLVIEPGGAVALAALLAGKINARNKVVGIVLSGGNVDPGLFVTCLGYAPFSEVST
jgi:threonine dehydratase